MPFEAAGDRFRNIVLTNKSIFPSTIAGIKKNPQIAPPFGTHELHSNIFLFFGSFPHHTWSHSVSVDEIGLGTVHHKWDTTTQTLYSGTTTSFQQFPEIIIGLGSSDFCLLKHEWPGRYPCYLKHKGFGKAKQKRWWGDGWNIEQW